MAWEIIPNTGWGFAYGSEYQVKKNDFVIMFWKNDKFLELEIELV